MAFPIIAQLLGSVLAGAQGGAGAGGQQAPAQMMAGGPDPLETLRMRLARLQTGTGGGINPAVNGPLTPEMNMGNFNV